MEQVLSVCVGIGLSAACGFRIFVPLLIMSMASLSGHLALAHGFEWIGTYPAMVAFSVATCLEIAGYYIPWVDHLLDTLATPAAIVAGIIVTASAVTDMSPFLKWTLAVIGGGGAAGIVQSGTVLTRAASSASTVGLGNPVVATLELGGATITSILALVTPILLVVLLVTVAFFIVRRLLRNSQRSRALQPGISLVPSK
jgi:hypothetical protein